MLFKTMSKRRQKLYEYVVSRLDALRVSFLSRDRILFIDAGANVGQAFSWFSSAFTSSRVDFVLFEPNASCYERLCRDFASNPRIKAIVKKACSVEDGTCLFYGTSEAEGGAFSQGGSSNSWHNSAIYEASALNAVTVETINFPNYIETMKDQYTKIIIKMDIEGSELDVLEDVIRRGIHSYIDTLYVEFHSAFANADLRNALILREKKICLDMEKAGVHLRVWH